MRRLFRSFVLECGKNHDITRQSTVVGVIYNDANRYGEAGYHTRDNVFN
jgi:hypothetical protein